MKTLDRLKIVWRLGFDKKHPKIFSFHDCLPDTFSGALELLMIKRYRILSAEELSGSLSRTEESKKEKPGISREAVLTFDDGRRNCWTVIFPLLKKFKAKAIFFVIPSRIRDSEEDYPNLEDYWNGKVSWEHLYSSHKKQPYLTWKELKIMQASGLVDIGSHSLKHEVAAVSSNVADFQHPGVYEMPVYFDEWFQAGMGPLDSLWGAPIHERAWAALVSNVYIPDQDLGSFMNAFVRKNGGFLFFKKRDWRKRLFEHFHAHKKNFTPGHFKSLQDKEELGPSIFESKKIIEERLKTPCPFFSLPLYHVSPSAASLIEEAGYRALLTGVDSVRIHRSRIFVLNRIPGFWIKYLSYL
jgi:hypothetical protein